MTSSVPKASECALGVPCNFGEPSPMTVLPMMIVGRPVVAWASFNAASHCAWSLPLIEMTCQW